MKFVRFKLQKLINGERLIIRGTLTSLFNYCAIVCFLASIATCAEAEQLTSADLCVNGSAYASRIETKRLEALAGDPVAARTLALLYFKGEKNLRTRRDYDQALTWYLRSAHKGHADAALFAAAMYAGGYGDQRNFLLAARWAFRAFWTKGESLALATHKKIRTAQKINELKQRARSLDIGTLLELGAYFGDYKSNHYAPLLSEKYFCLAAKSNNPEAMYQLGNIYLSSGTVAVNLRKALFWFLQGAKAGDGISQLYAGLFYQQGWDVEKNSHLAKSWFRAAVLSEVRPAKVLLSAMQ